MRKKYLLSYVFFYVLLSLLHTQLSSCFPKNMNFTSSNVTENKVSNEDQQIGKQPYSEMLSETADEMRINTNNLMRKKRSLSLSNVVIGNYDTLSKQGNLILKEVPNGFAGNNSFNTISEKIRSNHLNKNSCGERKRSLANFQNMKTAENNSKKKNEKDLDRRREADDNSDSVAERRKDSLSSSSRTLKRIMGQEPAKYSSVHGFEIGPQDESEDTVKEENIEKGNEKNLSKSKRTCDYNPNDVAAENNITKRNADYEESINQNDDYLNIQEEESEEDETESGNEIRFKRNEEDSDKDYEKELKSKADVERLEKNNAIEKREIVKKSLRKSDSKNLEKRQLKSEFERKTRQNQQIQRRNNVGSRNLREEVKNSEMEDPDSSKNNVEKSNTKLQPDQELSSQNKKLEFDQRFDKESSKGSETSGNLDLNVKENESEDDYEKRVTEQIKQRIDAIKEEIKREVEEKQKIEEIEENNAKYDELQSQNDENMSENQDSRNQQIIFKRSLREHNPNSERSKRQVVKRRRVSNSATHQQSASEYGDFDTNPDLNQNLNKENSIQDVNNRNSSEDTINQNSNSQRFNNKENISKRKTPLDDRIKRKRSTILTSKQAQVKIERKVPEDLVLDTKLGLDSSSLNDRKVRQKRSNSRVLRRVSKRRRANNLVPRGRFGYLRYRPQNIDDGTDEDGNEFEDDGFDDQTSNLDERGSTALRSSASSHEREDNQLNDPANFLLDNHNYLMRQKRAQLAAARSSRKKRHQLRKKKRKKRTSVKHGEERDKGGTGRSQELNPKLASEYKAFGGHQGNPDQALARFKRIKRVLRVS